MSLQLTVLQVYSKLFLSLFGWFLISPLPIYAGGVEITNYGHSSLLIKGGGKKILINPFKAIGCASGLKEPNVSVNLILASSQLADEGARVAKGVFLVEPGSYRIGNMKIEGFPVAHDRVGGRRFGQGTIWQWKQSGLNFAHLGGVAGPLGQKERILLGRPDILIIAVGGGPKVYNAKEAAHIVKVLNPHRVIPVQYFTKNSPKECKLNGVEPFISMLEGSQVKEVGKIFSFSKRNLENITITLFE